MGFRPESSPFLIWPFDLVSFSHPQRGSNPCLHLESVMTRVVAVARPTRFTCAICAGQRHFYECSTVASLTMRAPSGHNFGHKSARSRGAVHLVATGCLQRRGLFAQEEGPCLIDAATASCSSPSSSERVSTRPPRPSVATALALDSRRGPGSPRYAEATVSKNGSASEQRLRSSGIGQDGPLPSMRLDAMYAEVARFPALWS
jgi:hypothetical protein